MKKNKFVFFAIIAMVFFTNLAMSSVVMWMWGLPSLGQIEFTDDLPKNHIMRENGDSVEFALYQLGGGWNSMFDEVTATVTAVGDDIRGLTHEDGSAFTSTNFYWSAGNSWYKSFTVRTTPVAGYQPPRTIHFVITTNPANALGNNVVVTVVVLDELTPILPTPAQPERDVVFFLDEIKGWKSFDLAWDAVAWPKPDSPNNKLFVQWTSASTGHREMEVDAQSTGADAFLLGMISASTAAGEVVWMLRAEFDNGEGGTASITGTSNIFNVIERNIINGAMVGVPFTCEINFQNVSESVKFTATKLPPGLKINAATGVISGVPTRAGTYGATVKATNIANKKMTAVIKVSITVEPLQWNAQGTFNGAVFPVEGLWHVTGSLTMTVSSTGKITAKIVSTDGQWTFIAPSWFYKEDGIFVANLKNSKGRMLTLLFDSARPWNDLHMFGWLDGSSIVYAQRNPFLNKNDSIHNTTQITLSDYTGYYTMMVKNFLLEPSDSNEVKNFSQGFGYLTTTINNRGIAKISGKLSNGTAVNGSVPIFMFGIEPNYSENYAEIPFFFPLHMARGYVSDILSIPSRTHPIQGMAGVWHYPGKAPTQNPPAIEDRFTMLFILYGWHYDSTAKLADNYAGKRLVIEDHSLPLGKDDENGYINLGEIIPNGRGGVKLPAVKAPVWDNTNGKYAYNAANPCAATFSVNSRAGLFSGNFKLYEKYADNRGVLKLKTTTVPYRGVLLQMKDGNIGAGHYLIPETWKSGGETYFIKRSYPVVLE